MAYTKIVHPHILRHEDIRRIAHLQETARETIHQLCNGSKFTMSIPVQDDDTDIVLINALDGANRLVQEIHRIRNQVDQLLADEYDMPDKYRAKLMAIIFEGEGAP